MPPNNTSSPFQLHPLSHPPHPTHHPTLNPQCDCKPAFKLDAASGSCIPETCVTTIAGCLDCDNEGDTQCVQCKATDNFAGTVSADGKAVSRAQRGAVWGCWGLCVGQA